MSYRLVADIWIWRRSRRYESVFIKLWGKLVRVREVKSGYTCRLSPKPTKVYENYLCNFIFELFITMYKNYICTLYIYVHCAMWVVLGNINVENLAPIMSTYKMTTIISSSLRATSSTQRPRNKKFRLENTLTFPKNTLKTCKTSFSHAPKNGWWLIRVNKRACLKSADLLQVATTITNLWLFSLET